MSAQVPARGRPALAGDQAVLGPQGVHQVGHVGRVDDAELRRQRERLGVRPDDLMGYRVEGAADDPVGGARAARRDPGQHVVRGPAGEGQQQDPAGRRALAAQPARPGDQGPGLAGARPGQDQQRPGLMRGRPALVVVEPVKDIRRFEHEDECNGRGRAGRGPTPGEIRTDLPRRARRARAGREPQCSVAAPSARAVRPAAAQFRIQAQALRHRQSIQHGKLRSGGRDSPPKPATPPALAGDLFLPCGQRPPSGSDPSYLGSCRPSGRRPSAQATRDVAGLPANFGDAE